MIIMGCRLPPVWHLCTCDREVQLAIFYETEHLLLNTLRFKNEKDVYSFSKKI